jgi:hypothetical protein
MKIKFLTITLRADAGFVMREAWNELSHPKELDLSKADVELLKSGHTLFRVKRLAFSLEDGDECDK